MRYNINIQHVLWNIFLQGDSALFHNISPVCRTDWEEQKRLCTHDTYQFLLKYKGADLDQVGEQIDASQNDPIVLS